MRHWHVALASFRMASSATEHRSPSSFDQRIFSAFEQCRRMGDVLRTDPLASNVQRRRLPGSLGLVAAHEPDLFLKKRPAALPPQVSVDEPFDSSKFNFNSIREQEILLKISHNNESHPILVNISPLMFGHGLLIPWGPKCLPQRLTPDAIGLALHVLKQSQSELRVGFNSLGAFSSVNHLHIHILYPDELDRATNGCKRGTLFANQHGFPIEHAPIQKSLNSQTCQVDILDWKAPSFSFMTADHSALEQTVARFVAELFHRKIPHNVLFVLCNTKKAQKQIRAIVIPRQPQHHFDANAAGFNAALGEISGYLVARTKQDFQKFEERTVVDLFQRDVACDKQTMDNLCAWVETNC